MEEKFMPSHEIIGDNVVFHVVDGNLILRRDELKKFSGGDGEQDESYGTGVVVGLLENGLGTALRELFESRNSNTSKQAQSS